MQKEAVLEDGIIEEDDQFAQYLRTVIGGEVFGLRIMEVQEILEAPSITPVPHTSANLLGVCNVRGEIVAVVDMKRILGLGLNETRESGSTRAIVIRTGEFAVCILVDSVQDFISVPKRKIDLPNRVTAAKEQDYVVGIYRDEDENVVTLLNLETVLDPGNVLRDQT